MQGRILNAQVLGLGEYDFEQADGGRTRYIDLYDDEAGLPTQAVVRFTLDGNCHLPAEPSMGERVDLWFRVMHGEKVVRGESRDRAFSQLKLRATSIELRRTVPDRVREATKGEKLPAAA